MYLAADQIRYISAGSLNNFVDTDEGYPEELQVKTTQCDYCAISIL